MYKYLAIDRLDRKPMNLARLPKHRHARTLLPLFALAKGLNQILIEIKPFMYAYARARTDVYAEY